MRVIFSNEAKASLIAIGDYIAKDSPRRALAFVEKLEERALEIAYMPKAFQLVPRYEQYDIRRRPFGNYLIFYRIEQDRILIVQILHGAMDYEALLFDVE